jgi:hypothetical protein
MNARISRRCFLGSSAALCGGLTILPAGLVLAEEPAVPDKQGESFAPVAKKAAVPDKEAEKKSGANTGPYLANDGQLKAKLTFKNAQGGFVGFTGQLYTIQPNGDWTVQKFVNQKLDEPNRKGKLSKEQVIELAQSLAQQDFVGLPPQIGAPARANPHVCTVTFGTQSVAFILQPGEPLPKPGDGDDKTSPVVRVTGVCRTIEKLISETKGQ